MWQAGGGRYRRFVRSVALRRAVASRTFHAWKCAARLRLAIGLGLLMVAGMACARVGVPPSSGTVLPPSEAAQPSPSAAPAAPWGPLAMIRGYSGGDFAATEGTIRITATCAQLESRNGITDLLVWGTEQTTWDPVANEVEFRNRDGRMTRVRDGQFVRLGGSGEYFSDDPTNSDAVQKDEWLARMDSLWVVEPDPSCLRDGTWDVGNVLVDPYGPLAIVSDPPGGEEARTEGVVRMSDACVVLERADGTSALLVWPEGYMAETRWDPESRRIEFRTWSAESPVDISDGRSVMLIGSGPDPIPQDWTESFEWIARPDPSCPADSFFVISDVTLA